MLRLATAVSSYPFFNFRYRRLLTEFSRYFSVYVFSGSKLGKTRLCVRDVTYRVYYLFPRPFPRRIRYYLGGMNVCLSVNLVNPDIVWIFDTLGLMMPLLITRPIVLDVDDPTFSHKNVFSLVKEMYLLRNDRVKRIVVPTRMIKEKFVKIYGVSADKIEIIPNGVDLRLFRPSRMPSDDVVYYHGTFDLHRSRFLLRMAMEVLKQKKVKFLLVGDVPRWFKDYVEKSGLSDYFEFPGFVEHDDLPRYVAKAKVCIFPQDVSLGRGFSFKLIEYMACGRPIVATDVEESCPVRESGAGLIAPVNPKIFAGKIIELLEDEKLANELAERGVRYAMGYSWDNIVDKYLRLFTEILNERR